MKKRYLAWLTGVALGTSCSSAFSAIAPNAHLSFSASDVVCTLGYDANSRNSCQDEIVESFTGSYWALDVDGADSDGDGLLTDSWEWNYIEPNEGIYLGSAQPAFGSHTGTPDGSEIPSIDNPWVFYGNTGMHESTSPVNVLSDDGNGNVTLDFSGWGLIWNDIEDWHMGDPANFSADTNIASLTCAVDCSVGDTFVLEYHGHTPLNDPSGIGGHQYSLHLEGVVSAVPVPAALWLFLSGLLGLLTFKRRGYVHRHHENSN